MGWAVVDGCVPRWRSQSRIYWDTGIRNIHGQAKKAAVTANLQRQTMRQQAKAPHTRAHAAAAANTIRSANPGHTEGRRKKYALAHAHAHEDTYTRTHAHARTCKRAPTHTLIRTNMQMHMHMYMHKQQGRRTHARTHARTFTNTHLLRTIRKPCRRIARMAAAAEPWNSRRSPRGTRAASRIAPKVRYMPSRDKPETRSI